MTKTNPLTGESDFNEKAVGKRPIACVVENSVSARPQWGIADSKNPPDIIVEGEVEGGETRMLWMYADYTAVPSQIGEVQGFLTLNFQSFLTLFSSIGDRARRREALTISVLTQSLGRTKLTISTK